MACRSRCFRTPVPKITLGFYIEKMTSRSQAGEIFASKVLKIDTSLKLIEEKRQTLL